MFLDCKAMAMLTIPERREYINSFYILYLDFMDAVQISILLNFSYLCDKLFHTSMTGLENVNFPTSNLYPGLNNFLLCHIKVVLEYTKNAPEKRTKSPIFYDNSDIFLSVTTYETFTFKLCMTSTAIELRPNHQCS